MEDLISTFEQMRGYPEGDSNDPCFDLCGTPCCNEFGCLHAKVRAARALALPSASSPAQGSPEDMPKWLREAFDSDSVPKKNIALRMAYDEIVRPSAVVPSEDREDGK